MLTHQGRVMHIRQWTRPTLVQIMARRQFSAKSSSDPMTSPYQLYWKEISVKFESNYRTLYFKKISLKVLFGNWRPFFLGLIFLTMAAVPSYSNRLLRWLKYLHRSFQANVWFLWEKRYLNQFRPKCLMETFPYLSLIRKWLFLFKFHLKLFSIF